MPLLSSFRQRLRLVCIVVSVLGATVLSASQARARVVPRYGAEVAGLASVDRQTLDNFMGLAANDPRTYRDGVWTDPGTNCWWCLDEAAGAAATLARLSAPADPALLNVAIDTYNRAIRKQTRDGSWDENGVDTGFFVVDLATSYVELRDVLDRATRAAWATSIKRAADYLIATHELSWYINGNVNLRQAEVMWLAWKVAGDSRYRAHYEYEWNFTMNPPRRRWPGFGLKLTVIPHKSDGSDGAGYLAESAGSVPGFDAEYTMTQLDTAASMWVMSHDHRWLRLMNLFFNKLRPRINTSFSLDALGGSRHSQWRPFYSGGLAILYNSGDRPDLASLVPGQLERLESEYTNVGNYNSQNFYRGLSGWLSLIILDYQRPGGLIERASSATPCVATNPRGSISADRRPTYTCRAISARRPVRTSRTRTRARKRVHRRHLPSRPRDRTRTLRVRKQPAAPGSRRGPASHAR